MERCRLCYGVLVGGKCLSCGLDNSKSDKQYRLNVHNEKAARLHGGSCEENLNTRPKGRTVNVQSRTASGMQRSRTASGTERSRAAASNGQVVYGKRRMSAAERKKQLKLRHATGTVQKRKGKKWIIILILIIWYLLSFLENANWHQYTVSNTAVTRIAK